MTQSRGIGSGMETSVHKRVLLAALMLAMWSASAFAADWIVAERSGTVFVLSGAEWIDLGRGDAVPPDGLVRTVGRGTVILQVGGGRIGLGANTTVQLAESAGGHSGWSVRQYSGALRVEVASGTVSVMTPFVVAVSTGGVLVSEIGDYFTRIAASGGKVLVTSGRDGSKVTILPGQMLTSAIAPNPGDSGVVGVAEPVILPAAAADIPNLPNPGSSPSTGSSGGAASTAGSTGNGATGSSGNSGSAGSGNSSGGNANVGANGAAGADKSGGDGSSASGGAAGGTASSGQSSGAGNSGQGKGSASDGSKKP